MKILYAIQGTGNGHLSRAMEIAPHLVEKAEVDFLISGISAELDFPFPFKYEFHGASFFFGKRGGVNYLKSFRHFKPLRLIKDIQSLNVKVYDAILSDFEPISAWAGKRNKVKVIGLSHQAAFLSDKCPRPENRNRVFEFGMKRIVAPCDTFIGLHYKKYDNNIFLPIIRKSLIEKVKKELDHIAVYLPAFSDSLLISHFKKLKKYKWKIFSKRTNSVYEHDNIEVSPISREKYDNVLCSAAALLIGAGFQGTSEGLYCKKKMMVIPMFDQYEQICNAAALKEMGVRVVTKIESNFSEVLKDWLKSPNKCEYHFEPNTQSIARQILNLC